MRARGRDWIVLPQEEQDIVRLRPIDGGDDDAIGVHTGLEPNALRSATYQPPDPAHARGSAPGRLLHDAARLRLRSGAGPFRSMGRLSVSPRPYQLVPLVMALRLDPVRLLIGDDVGVGKTIEAALIARELLDRGAVQRLGVLCPPHLCDQWVRELAEKFKIWGEAQGDGDDDPPQDGVRPISQVKPFVRETRNLLLVSVPNDGADDERERTLVSLLHALKRGTQVAYQVEEREGDLPRDTILGPEPDCLLGRSQTMCPLAAQRRHRRTESRGLHPATRLPDRQAP